MRLITVLLASTLMLSAADWTRFRGPNGVGVSPEKGLPSEIGKDKNVLWSQKTPKGHSSPIIVGDKLFITGHEGDERLVLCYNANTGELIWKKSVTKLRHELPHPLNGHSTPTAATDGKNVFAFIPEFGLVSYDFAGKENWRVQMGPFGGIQGMAQSPIYVDGRVVLLVDTPDVAYVVAYDAATGKQAWKSERTTGFLGSYATPSIYQPKDGPTQIIVAGALELTGYQARTGERLWWARGVCFGPAVSPLIVGDSVYTMEPVESGSTPFKDTLAKWDKNKDGKLEVAELTGDAMAEQIWKRILKSADKNNGNGDGIVTEDEHDKAFNGMKGGLVKFKLGGKGDATESVTWRYTKGLPYVLAPVLYDGVLYVIRNGGVLSTIDPEKGERLREERLKDALGEYYANPVAADGKLYFINKDGKATVVRAGKDWEILSSGDFGEQVIATPAIANGRIYVRTEDTMYAFAVKPATN